MGCDSRLRYARDGEVVVGDLSKEGRQHRSIWTACFDRAVKLQRTLSMRDTMVESRLGHVELRDCQIDHDSCCG